MHAAHKAGAKRSWDREEGQGENAPPSPPLPQERSQQLQRPAAAAGGAGAGGGRTQRAVRACEGCDRKDTAAWWVKTAVGGGVVWESFSAATAPLSGVRCDNCASKAKRARPM